jgi:hypothetical protein
MYVALQISPGCMDNMFCSRRTTIPTVSWRRSVTGQSLCAHNQCSLLQHWPANQTTKKLTKGGVLRKRQTSSVARFDHSCEWNALLEMVKGALKL